MIILKTCASLLLYISNLLTHEYNYNLTRKCVIVIGVLTKQVLSKKIYHKEVERLREKNKINKQQFVSISFHYKVYIFIRSDFVHFPSVVSDIAKLLCATYSKNLYAALCIADNSTAVCTYPTLLHIQITSLDIPVWLFFLFSTQSLHYAKRTRCNLYKQNTKTVIRRF